MPAPLPPMLCRYVGPPGVNILRTGKLAYVPPKDFNDPFDTSPGICERIEDDVLKRLFTRAKANRPWAQGVSFAQFKAAFEDQKGSFRRNVIDELWAARNSQFGIVCASEIMNDPLMWSHYAERHTGITICFDTSHPWVANHFGRVIYSKHRPLFDLDGDTTPEAFITKSEFWSREAEWRALTLLDECEALKLDARTLYLRPFPPDAVSLVVLGCRSSDQLREEIASNLRGWGFCKAKLGLNVESRSDYEFHTVYWPLECWGSW